ncbi:MAG TPA: hypothetical protein VLN44_10075, partial [Pyrinomonadaceae bacterium]|nr:hypothetical protein [Pyrinomonadaceae bacterium]
WLKSEVAALKREVNPAAAEEIHQKFAGLAGSDANRLRTAIEIGMKGVQDQVLDDITQFQLRNRRADPKAIHDWLAATKERYEVWFGRL